MLSPRPTVILVILSDTEILIRNTTQNYYIVFVGNHLCCWFIVCLCRNVLCLQKQIPLSLYVCVCVCVCACIHIHVFLSLSFLLQVVTLGLLFLLITWKSFYINISIFGLLCFNSNITACFYIYVGFTILLL